MTTMVEPQQTAPQPPEKKHGMPAWAIALIAVGGALLVAIVTFGALYLTGSHGTATPAASKPAASAPAHPAPAVPVTSAQIVHDVVGSTAADGTTVTGATVIKPPWMAANGDEYAEINEAFSDNTVYHMHWVFNPATNDWSTYTQFQVMSGNLGDTSGLKAPFVPASATG